jgi:hypothetical protein
MISAGLYPSDFSVRFHSTRDKNLSEEAILIFLALAFHWNYKGCCINDINKKGLFRLENSS